MKAFFMVLTDNINFVLQEQYSIDSEPSLLLWRSPEDVEAARDYRSVDQQQNATTYSDNKQHTPRIVVSG